MPVLFGPRCKDVVLGAGITIKGQFESEIKCYWMKYGYIYLGLS